MLTGFKIKTYDFLGRQEFFKKRYLKKQWNSIALVGEDDDAVETAIRCPTWFSSLVTGATSYFIKGQGVGGLNDLAYPLQNSILGDLWIAQYKFGKTQADLVPSLVPLAIEEVKKLKKSVVVTFKGIGGGPDLIRLWSSGALRCTERPLNPEGRAFDTEYKLYSKVVIGVDDTDSAVKGATFNTALQSASVLDRSSKDFHFLRLTLSLNWPANPVKTTNNASSALVFAVTRGKEEELVRDFERLIRKYSISKETGMVVMNKIRAPEVLKTYARKVKREHVTVDEAFKAAEQAGVRAITVTGERGLIGALAAVGLVDDVEEAVTPVTKSEPVSAMGIIDHAEAVSTAVKSEPAG
jgi:methanogenesis imperfect marker protein 11